jgi:two-component system OmpR family response regulator
MRSADVNLLTDLLVHRASHAEAASVLLVAPPGAVPEGLAEAICAAGFSLAVHEDADSAMQAALAEPPTCLVCNAELPDADGYALTRWLRAHDTGPLASATVLLLTAPDDLAARLRGYRAGADVCMSAPPCCAREVVIQIDALVRFATRDRGAITGDIGVVPIMTLLSVLELERRTGVFEVVSDGVAAHLEILSGQIAAARLLGAPTPAVEGVRAMAGWARGRFCFRPSQVRARSASASISIGEALAEAARLGDEAAA